MDDDQVLYVYKCKECGRDGQIHLSGDQHDGAPTSAVPAALRFSLSGMVA